MLLKQFCATKNWLRGSLSISNIKSLATYHNIADFFKKIFDVWESRKFSGKAENLKLKLLWMTFNSFNIWTRSEQHFVISRPRTFRTPLVKRWKFETKKLSFKVFHRFRRAIDCHCCQFVAAILFSEKNSLSLEVNFSVKSQGHEPSQLWGDDNSEHGSFGLVEKPLSILFKRRIKTGENFHDVDSCHSEMLLPFLFHWFFF